MRAGRGKYGFGKKKKYRKLLYPVLIGLFITKMIMFPMFVKAVTFLSSASFVFSKMSLLASLILGLKFFLTNNNQQGESKVEIVHVPMKKYGGGDWDRETAESKFHVNTIPDTVYEHDFRPTQYVLWRWFDGMRMGSSGQKKRRAKKEIKLKYWDVGDVVFATFDCIYWLVLMMFNLFYENKE